MARPLSEEKRDAILQAAARIVALEGTEAATGRIARAAGVAEGTVFKYFASKDILLNALYLAIKDDVAAAIVTALPPGCSAIEGFEAVWRAYVQWGLDNTAARRAMMQLGVSDRLTAKTRELSFVPFSPIDHLLHGVIGDSFGGTPAYASAIMSALAETTIQFIAANPGQRDALLQNGFRALLRAFGSPA